MKPPPEPRGTETRPQLVALAHGVAEGDGGGGEQRHQRVRGGVAWDKGTRREEVGGAAGGFALSARAHAAAIPNARVC